MAKCGFRLLSLRWPRSTTWSTRAVQRRCGEGGTGLVMHVLFPCVSVGLESRIRPRPRRWAEQWQRISSTKSIIRGYENKVGFIPKIGQLSWRFSIITLPHRCGSVLGIVHGSSRVTISSTDSYFESGELWGQPKFMSVAQLRPARLWGAREIIIGIESSVTAHLSQTVSFNSLFHRRI